MPRKLKTNHEISFSFMYVHTKTNLMCIFIILEVNLDALFLHDTHQFISPAGSFVQFTLSFSYTQDHLVWSRQGVGPGAGEGGRWHLLPSLPRRRGSQGQLSLDLTKSWERGWKIDWEVRDDDGEEDTDDEDISTWVVCRGRSWKLFSSQLLCLQNLICWWR